MFDRDNFKHIPDLLEVSDYVNNDLFDKFCEYMIDTYKIKPKLEFSKCTYEYGWNIKFKKGSKSLCTIYPRENYFTILIVIGRKEKECFLEMLSTFSNRIKEIYNETKEGNGQVWLMIDLEDDDKTYEDVKKIINIRSL